MPYSNKLHHKTFANRQNNIHAMLNSTHYELLHKNVIETNNTFSLQGTCTCIITTCTRKCNIADSQ